ncbi:MAG: UDP-N-acetylglucosamine 2-epimerase (non-hydrolyzing) [Bacteroidales bacterium]|nr:UDP-N-acetylglucosamine 2-epimerase (non-hydrolyzing) [Lentimicrobiaceae bacterium]MDD5694472.1 UDP-N-acetylglucosamine 2-epimerase (non-hydrolyzing) [Bacteroidales bacterium]
MMRITTVIGARPQFIKAAAISRAIRETFPRQITECIIHTGQHYDQQMSQVFFEQLRLPLPDINLEVGSHHHGKQTALMISRLESELQKSAPHAVLVYGDTNSTLAGALAAAKIQIPVIHIEAGMRSFNKTMPEEINRILCDHISTLLFTPTLTGMHNLEREGLVHHLQSAHTIDHPGIYHCGDVMYDNCLYFESLARKKSAILKEHGLNPGEFVLATIHRAQNTDDPRRLKDLFTAISVIAREEQIKTILPLHPRTAMNVKRSLPDGLLFELSHNNRLILTGPVSYFDMLMLEKNARLILTDSGGVQKEAYFFQKPCIILRAETEWQEIVDVRSAILADADPDKIIQAFRLLGSSPSLSFPPIFGDGDAASFICRKTLETLG